MSNNPNQQYLKIIDTFISKCDPESYLVMGSVATLSYTSKIGYVRKIHDLDIIMDRSEVKKLSHKLEKSGFKKMTFIDKRMPFFRKLQKQSKLFYLRFNKGEINIEILSTKFTKDGKTLKFELYPNVWIEVPQSLISVSFLEKTTFSTLDVNLLWAIKQFLNNTLGLFVHYKSEQRENDLLHLRKLVNLGKAKNYFYQCRLGCKFFSICLPKYIF